MNVGVFGKPLRTDIEQGIADYVECGYGLIKGMFSPDEIDRLVRESDRLWQQHMGAGAGNLRIGIRTDLSGKLVLDRLDPVVDISETFAAVNQDRRLVAIAESGLGEAVTVMKEKLIYKWPGTRGFGAHRDQAYTTPKSGVPGAEVMTISIALDRATRFSGPTEFFPTLRNRATAAPASEPRDVDERELHGVASCMPENDPGDVILFDGQIPHRSDWNRSDHCRRIYMISYVPARYPDARRNYYAARISEQKEMRRDLVEGSIFFE
ncbi:MAG: phytanoyl-CoA dioxygenase family protein [Gammaproteobacteria bacterium]|nr:phytanoyl-CoA dioxygenase family protein [Gammaproteobacteria bacterium]